MTSTDGIIWISRNSAADNNWNSVTYGNGLFVAVAASGLDYRVMTSPDGIVWTSRMLTLAPNNSWTSITYGNGLFVAVATTGTGDRVMTSTDGIIWISRNSAADNIWTSVTYGNGLFVAIAASGLDNRVMTSPDGIVWTSNTTAQAPNNTWRSVTYSNGMFVAVSSTGTGNRVTTWTPAPAATAPTVTTQAVTAITSTTATGNGNITDLGSANPTAYGVCWNTTGTPTIANSKTDKGAISATGAFTADMTGLNANTTYYVRAFATNSVNTSYGVEVTFSSLITSLSSTIKSDFKAISTAGGKITLSGINEAEVLVFNQLGQQLFTGRILNGMINKHFAKGIYFVKVDNTIQKVFVR